MFSDTCVILCAGKGSRMEGDIPKSLIKIEGKPILQRIIDFCKDMGVNKFIFVVGYRKDLIVEYLVESKLKDYKVIVQSVQNGIADAILQVEDYVSDRFIVALGDCLNIGHFEHPVNMTLGYGILDSEYKNTQARGCNVIVFNNEIVAVYEKPPMDYAGIGTYFFDHRVFNYIRNTKPNKEKNEIDIADVMTNMVKDGQHIKAVRFVGDFVNCTTQKDITRADQFFKA